MTIQTQGLRLFREQGYDATTVQQIIDAADGSESTFVRCFPTKADVVLLDTFDPLIAASFLGQPPELTGIQALRASFRTVFAGLSAPEAAEQQERTRLVVAVPKLRATVLDQFASAMLLLADWLAERTGRKAGDMAVRALAGAVVGVVVAAWWSLLDDPTADLAALLDEAMGHLETGLRL